VEAPCGFVAARSLYTRSLATAEEPFDCFLRKCGLGLSNFHYGGAASGVKCNLRRVACWAHPGLWGTPACRCSSAPAGRSAGGSSGDFCKGISRRNGSRNVADQARLLAVAWIRLVRRLNRKHRLPGSAHGNHFDVGYQYALV
jgi:hypothetical protein